MGRYFSALRVTATLLGIASAVLMAEKAFGFTFSRDFMLGLKLVENSVGWMVYPLDILVVQPVLNWLHAHGIAFYLRDHWRYVFVLQWLLFGAFARALFPRAEGEKRWLAIFCLAWGFCCALLSGILSGIVELSDTRVFFWSMGGFFLYVLGISAVANIESRDYSTFIITSLCMPIAAVLCFITPSFPLLTVDFAIIPPLAELALVVALGAIISVITSSLVVSRSEGHSIRNWLNRPLTRAGADVLSVLGGAAIVVYLARLTA